jgi:hypothetical protein
MSVEDQGFMFVKVCSSPVITLLLFMSANLGLIKNE